MRDLTFLFICPYRLLRVAVVLRPSTLLAFHAALVRRKYRILFSPQRHLKPGPKGPSPELVVAIVETKNASGLFSQLVNTTPTPLFSHCSSFKNPRKCESKNALTEMSSPIIDRGTLSNLRVNAK